LGPLARDSPCIGNSLGLLARDSPCMIDKCPGAVSRAAGFLYQGMRGYNFCQAKQVNKMAWLAFLTPGTNNHKAVPDGNYKLKKKQDCLLIILLFILKIKNLLNADNNFFSFQIFILPPLGLCSPGRQHHSPPPHTNHSRGSIVPHLNCLSLYPGVS